MTAWWQPSFDPMEELILARRQIQQLEHNQQGLIQAQNDLGQAVKTLVGQHNELIQVLDQHRQVIQRLQLKIQQP